MNKCKYPMRFQGHKNKRKYFEGWYYKLVSKDGNHSVVFIPGISLNNSNPHAFIQVFLTNHQEKSLATKYIEYSIDAFNYDAKINVLSLGNCKFGLDDITIDIAFENISIVGHVNMYERKDIKRTFISPSIMGFFRYVPKMECYHGVVSMSHKLDGKLNINNKSISFNKGKGYIEKDWGTSFPEEYVWIQSNHFENPDTSFMLSYAKIPFLGMKFNGFIVNLVLNHKEYRFATYNFSKVAFLEVSEHKVIIIIKKGRYSLKVIAKNKETVKLVSPKNGLMNNQIKEGLSGEVELSLYKSEILIYHDIGKQTGLEIMLK